MIEGGESEKVSFLKCFTIQPDDHPLITDSTRQIVISMIPQASHSTDGKSMSIGGLNYIVDDGTAMITTALDPKFRPNVSVTLDIKFLQPIPLGEQIDMLVIVQDIVANYVNQKFEIYSPAGKLLAYGSHLKAFLVKGQVFSPTRQKL